MRGFSTLEILFALTILTISLGGILSMSVELPTSLDDGETEQDAISRASELLALQIIQARDSFSSIHSIATTTEGDYSFSLSAILLPDGVSKSITSSVAWTSLRGLSQFASIHAVVTDFKNMSSNSFCSSVISGNWTLPKVSVYSFKSDDLLPIGINGGPYPVSTLNVSTTTLLAGVTDSKNKSDPTVFLFDISSSTHPLYLSSFDNSSSTKQGVNSFAVNGSYVYIANADTPDFSTCIPGPACSQLQIARIDTPYAPRIIENFQLPTSTIPYAVGSGGQANAKSIVYKDGLVYLGLTKPGNTLGQEFIIINVENPYAPFLVGSYPTERTINRIIVMGTYAYLATDDSLHDLIILDVSDPKNIKQVGSYDAPGTNGFGYARDIAVSSTTILLGRTYTPTGPELSILQNSSTPQLISNSPFTDLSNPITIESIILRNFLAYILTSSSLLFFDVHDTSRPQEYSPPLQLTASSSGTSLICRLNTMYLSSIGSDQTGYLTIVSPS